MTNEQMAMALKQTVDALAKEGDQWLLEEPFIWEKHGEWEWSKGDVVPYPYVSNFSCTEVSIAAGAAIDTIIKGSPLDDTFVCVYRDGEMMVLSVPDWHDIMIPFIKHEKVYLSIGLKDIYNPPHYQPFYDVYPNTQLWVNGEKVIHGEGALNGEGLQVHGSWQVRGGGIAYRCVPKEGVVCIRQEGKGGWSVHGPVWANPTCIFYKV